jgi:hypothetical protein
MFGKLNLIIISIFICFIISKAYSAEKAFRKVASKSLEVQLWFKAATAENEKNKLHQKLGAKLLYRAKNFPVDVLEITEQPNLKIPFSEVAICELYLHSNLVEHCEPTKMLPPPVELCRQVSEVKKMAFATLSREKCNLFPDDDLIETPGLPARWSQLRIGADLVRNEFKELAKHGGISSNEVNVGNIDGGFDISGSGARGSSREMTTQSGGEYPDHGTKAVNLIAGFDDYGASTKARISFIRDGYSAPGKFLQSLDEAISEKTEVVNLEIHMLYQAREQSESWLGERNVLIKAVNDASKKMIVVGAAGNQYPKGSGSDSAYKNDDLIVVGSADPFGLVSDFSDESPDVTVLAPSDSYQRVKGKDPTDTYFGGTSGAAPLATAAVADIKAILGDLNGAEAAKILKLSSTKMPITNVLPQKNGAGMLNSYRAVMIAARLKKMGWPTDRTGLLKAAEKWDFKDLAEQNVKFAERDLVAGDCSRFRLAFDSLRKAVLLDEQSDKARQMLATIYEAQEYNIEARYLHNLKTENLKIFLKDPWASPEKCKDGECSLTLSEYNTGYSILPTGKSLNRAKEMFGISTQPESVDIMIEAPSSQKPVNKKIKSPRSRKKLKGEII